MQNIHTVFYNFSDCQPKYISQALVVLIMYNSIHNVQSGSIDVYNINGQLPPLHECCNRRVYIRAMVSVPIYCFSVLTSYYVLPVLKDTSYTSQNSTM